MDGANPVCFFHALRFPFPRRESDDSHPEGCVELLVSFADFRLENLIMWSLESDLLTEKGAPRPRFLWVSLCLGQVASTKPLVPWHMPVTQ